jgi:hypothetical protein
MAELSLQRVLLVVGTVVLLAAGSASLSGCGGPDAEPPEAAQSSPELQPSGPASNAPTLTAQQQAEKDLDRLVRDYYAAENAVYLDPASDPSAALDPYLRNPASAARIADILSFRSAGHTLESRSTTVVSVTLQSYESHENSQDAVLLVCKSLSAKGVDGTTGSTAEVSDRGLITWSASAADGRDWHLMSYEGIQGEEGAC